jgi:hypothetical protein
MSIPLIRAALKTRLETIPGVRAVDEVPGAVTVTGSASAAVVQYGGTTYDSTMGRQSDEMVFSILMIASKASDRAGIAKIDGYLARTGATSVKAAVDGPIDPDVASDVRVSSAGGYNEITIGSGTDAQEFIGVEFVVEVMVP